MRSWNVEEACPSNVDDEVESEIMSHVETFVVLDVWPLISMSGLMGVSLADDIIAERCLVCILSCGSNERAHSTTKALEPCRVIRHRDVKGIEDVVK